MQDSQFALYSKINNIMRKSSKSINLN